MKYEQLYQFKNYVMQLDALEHNTKQKYYHAVKSLVDDISFDKLEDIKPDELMLRLNALRTKNDVSAAKRGLELLQDFYPKLQLPDELPEVSSHKRNIKKRTFETVKLDTIKRKLYAIQDPKLRIGYELMLDTGLRVGEVAQITKDSISVDDEQDVYLHIEHFKGGKAGYRKINSEKLAQKLLIYADTITDQEQPIFYSSGHMKNKAHDMGFECHDLRRAFAKTNYREIKQDVGAYRAKEEVRNIMDHADIRTTKKYLKRKIIMD